MKRYLPIALLVLVLAVAGCGRTVEDVKIPLGSPQDVTFSDIGKRIEQAGKKLDWQLDWQETSHAMATWRCLCLPLAELPTGIEAARAGPKGGHNPVCLGGPCC